MNGKRIAFMRKLPIFCLFLFVIIIHFGCIKDRSTYTISGKIFISCTNTPLANQELSFFQTISSNGIQTSGGDLGTTTTDSTGYFLFRYISKNNEGIKIQKAAGFGFSTIVENVPAKENLDNLVIQYGPRTTVQVKLNVLKPYTANDTLYITDFRDTRNFLKVRGPFTSGVLYNAPNHGFENSYYPESYLQVVRYKIANNSSWIKKNFPPVACDTSRVTIDIN